VTVKLMYLYIKG